MENKGYIYVSAVNLYRLFNQSEDLSIYRGASLKLREATVLLSQQACFLDKLTQISIGASTGLYECIAGNEEKLTAEVQTYLNTNYFGYSFVVVSCLASDCQHNFSLIKEFLIQKSRLAQLKQSTLSFSQEPPHADLQHNNPVCKFSDLLSANHNATVNGRTGINNLLKERFDYGRAKKQQFYYDELNILNGSDKLPALEFTNNIQEIASNALAQHKQLESKVAYVYLDGNKFSAIQSEVVSDKASQIEFDSAIQRFRATFLRNFLAHASKEPSYLTPDNKLRFETLLWGGDEMLFVLPAWKGFEFVDFFLKESATWQYKGFSLTHSLGLVFCSHKSSVHVMRELATNLADKAKTIPTNQNREPHSALSPYLANKYNFIVLESIDYPNEPLDKHNNRVYQALGAIKDQSCFSAINYQPIDFSELNKQLACIAKGQVYHLAKAAMALAKSYQQKYNKESKHSDNDRKKALLDVDQQSLKVAENRAESVSENLCISELKALLLKFYFGENSTVENVQLEWLVWVLLAESWDYLPSITPNTAEEQA